MTRVLHSGKIAKFGYAPNVEHAGELRIRTAHHEMALRMLAAAADDDGDRFNYRALVSCLLSAGLRQWIVQDSMYTRLNCFDQSQSSACTGHGRSMQIALEDAITCVSAGPPAANAAGSNPSLLPVFKAMPAPEVQYPFGLMIDGTLGHDGGCSGSGIVEGSERYGTYYELPADGDSIDNLPQGNWAGATAADEQRIAAWYKRIETFATHGVPPAIAAAAAAHKSQSHANVTTPAQAWAALGHGYPILICSNVSFEADRNEEGIIAATGHNWPHCMCISSRRTSAKHGRLYLVHQSWFADWTSGPYYLDQPIGSFWISEQDLGKILVCQWNRRMVTRDCWTSSGHQGFTQRADKLPTWMKNAG